MTLLETKLEHPAFPLLILTMKDCFVIMGSYFPRRTGESILSRIISEIVDGKEVRIDMIGFLSKADIADNLLPVDELQIGSGVITLIPQQFLRCQG